jgi:hypothetical protein
MTVWDFLAVALVCVAWVCSRWLDGRILEGARLADREARVADLALMTEAVEKVAGSFRSALGYTETDEQAVESPELFGTAREPIAMPAAEIDDVGGYESGLVWNDDGTVATGWEEAGLPVPPGEEGL